MKKKHTAHFGFSTLCILLGLLVFFAGIVLALFAAANPQALTREHTRATREQTYRANRPAIAPVGGVYEAWLARYNGTGNNYDEAIAVAVDNSNNVYVAGTSRGSGTLNDYATIKYNSAGEQLWLALYNDPENPDAQLNAMTIDGSGNVYVTGWSGVNNVYYDCTTIKYNSAGQQLWVARYNGQPRGYASGAAIVVDASGNVYVAASVTNQPNASFCATIKYNALGEQQWVAEYHGGANADYLAAIAVDNAGNVCVTGTSYLCFGNDYLTLKYNSAGQEQWVERYNGPKLHQDDAKAIAVDDAGNVYVTGHSFTSYATIKYNPAGQQQWAARADGGEGNAIALDGAGNVYVTGQISDPGMYSDYGTIKYNAAGQQQWLARYNGPPGNGPDIATSIALDGSSNVYVTGRSSRINASFNNFGYATVKYDSTGQEQWVVRYDEPGNADNEAEAIAVDQSSNVYVTGIGNNDYVTIKYGQGPSPTPTPTATASPTPTPTGTSTPTITPTATATASPSPTPTGSPTPSTFPGAPVVKPTGTVFPSPTATASLTPSTFDQPAPTATATATATATPVQTCCKYITSSGTGTIVPGIIDTGNHCDNCLTLVTLPFPVTFYNSSFSQAYVSSNGNLQFTGNAPDLGTSCPLPNRCLGAAILAYQGDLRTDGPGNGIFTLVTGSAPNRIFNIEWRTTYPGHMGTANFELRFYENQNSFDVIYGATADNGASEESGVQLSGSGVSACDATTFSCNSAMLTNGLKVTYQLWPCAAPTPTATATPTLTAAPTATATPTPTPTGTPRSTPTPRSSPAPRPRPSPAPRP